jgi:hypothetical protein
MFASLNQGEGVDTLLPTSPEDDNAKNPHLVSTIEDNTNGGFDTDDSNKKSGGIVGDEDTLASELADSSEQVNDNSVLATKSESMFDDSGSAKSSKSTTNSNSVVDVDSAEAASSHNWLIALFLLVILGACVAFLRTKKPRRVVMK